MQLKPQHSCPTCAPVKVELLSDELNDDGIYKFVCAKGHEIITITQLYAFEILYEIGLRALYDGYPDAAVSRFATSLERFYEYCIKLWLFKQGMTEEDITKLWKKNRLAKNSQAQFGAFLALYQMEKAVDSRGLLPEMIPNEQKWVEFRNDVIHSGHIPSFEKAKQYAKVTFDFMSHTIFYLTESYNPIVRKAVGNHVAERRKKAGGKPYGISNIS